MLSPEQVRQFREQGYTVCSGLLSADEVARFQAEIDGISRGHTLAQHDKTRLEMEPNQPPNGTRVRRIYQPCTQHPTFRELSESAGLLDCVEQLLGPDLLFHYSKINMKPAEIGSVVEWHQDLSYYPLTCPDSLAVLFYLDDATRENGCLLVIPGAHTGRVLDHTRDGYFQGRVVEAIDESRSVPLEGRAGTAIFLHGLTPHASATNQSRQPRRTLILSYRAADAFPIFCGDSTATAESHVRLVRGRRLTDARFTLPEFPIPVYQQQIASLYELQELSRKGAS